MLLKRTFLKFVYNKSRLSSAGSPQNIFSTPHTLMFDFDHSCSFVFLQCLLGPGAGPDGAMAPTSEFGPGPNGAKAPTYFFGPGPNGAKAPTYLFGPGPSGAMAPTSFFGPGPNWGRGPILQNVKIIGILMSIIKFYYSKMNIHRLLAVKAR